jgi:hypothetical protein
VFSNDDARDLFRLTFAVRREKPESTAKVLTPFLAFVGAILGGSLVALLNH